MHQFCGKGYSWFVVQSLRCVGLFATSGHVACQAPLSSINSQGLLKVMHIESATLTNHLVLCHSPSFCLPSFPAPFQCVDFCIRWPKYWSFSSSLCAFNEYSGLICFRIDRCYLQWTFKSFSTSQFESLSSSALSLLYGPTLTSIQNYWKKTKV